MNYPEDVGVRFIESEKDFAENPAIGRTNPSDWTKSGITLTLP